MAYTAEQEKNIRLITNSLNKFGITNQNLQAAILATVSKESNFIPKVETSYKNTSAERIRKLFGKRFANMTDAEIDALKKDDVAFFDKLYMNVNGNVNKGDGYKYRGRGFNQLTFKNNYKARGAEIGRDLESNPELVNNPEIAADVVAHFFKSGLQSGVKLKSFEKFGVKNVGDIKDTTTATKVAIQINGGLGIPFENNILQEGYNKAVQKVTELMGKVKSYGSEIVSEGVGLVKKKPLIVATVAISTIAIVVGSYFAYVKWFKKK